MWRHLDTCQFKTFLHARVLRVECPEHGVLQVKVPWVEAKGRFTLLMERLIIDVLRECATVAGACRLMRISRDEAWNWSSPDFVENRRERIEGQEHFSLGLTLLPTCHAAPPTV